MHPGGICSLLCTPSAGIAPVSKLMLEELPPDSLPRTPPAPTLDPPPTAFRASPSLYPSSAARFLLIHSRAALLQGSLTPHGLSSGTSPQGHFHCALLRVLKALLSSPGRCSLWGRPPPCPCQAAPCWEQTVPMMEAAASATSCSTSRVHWPPPHPGTSLSLEKVR